MPAFGIAEKPAPVEKESPLLPLMDAWIQHEKDNVDTASGAKATLKESFKSLTEARRFQSDIQAAARQRDRGFRTTSFTAYTKDGEVKPDEDGKYADPESIVKVDLEGALGARKRRQGQAKAEAEAKAAEKAEAVKAKA